MERLFKEGDWIVSEHGNVLQVAEFSEYGYYCASPVGYETLVYFGEQEDYHLWTLYDAKEGDVLKSKGLNFLGDDAWMCVFKKLESSDGMSVHCYKPYDTDDVCIPEDDDTFTTTCLEPASFKDIKRFIKLLQNRGYYFDKDEKRSKPIELFLIDEDNTDTFTLDDLKPFDKVLVRHHLHRKDGISLVWEAMLFSHYTNVDEVLYRAGGFTWKECVPYNEETSYLLGTTKDYEGKYKTW